MGAPDELDALIRDARLFEDPTLEERASVRRAVALRIAGGLGAAAATRGAIGTAPRAARRAASSAAVAAGVLPMLALVVLCGLSGDASAPALEQGDDAVLEARLPPQPAPAAAPLGDASQRAPEPVAQQPSSVAASSAVAAPASHAVARGAGPEPRAPQRPAPAARAVQSNGVQSSRPSLAAESRALAAVKRALRDGEPQRALGMLDEQDRAFALGVLVPERSAARVMALCAAQRRDDAERAKAAFSVRHPQSPLLARVRESCSRSGVR